jgi:hypothetical protein
VVRSYRTGPPGKMAGVRLLEASAQVDAIGTPKQIRNSLPGLGLGFGGGTAVVFQVGVRVVIGRIIRPIARRTARVRPEVRRTAGSAPEAGRTRATSTGMETSGTTSARGAASLGSQVSSSNEQSHHQPSRRDRRDPHRSCSSCCLAANENGDDREPFPRSLVLTRAWLGFFKTEGERVFWTHSPLPLGTRVRTSRTSDPDFSGSERGWKCFSAA